MYFIFSIFRLDDAKKYHEIDRDQINKLNQQLSEYESEINLLRRTIESLETERARDRERLARIQHEVDKLRVVSIYISLSGQGLVNLCLLGSLNFGISVSVI